MTRALLVAALAAAVALVPAPAPGCAVIVPAGGFTATAGELAVIIWDDAAQVEHFTRSAAFRGTSADFGFLVPTPGRPTLADAPGPIAERLEATTVPRVVKRQRLGDPGLGCAAAPKATFTTVGAALPAAVQVVERKRVGGFDAAVLKATDAATLRGWLGSNGYVSRPELDKWLTGYVEDDWHLTAFKLANDPTAAVGGTLSAVRLSFPTAVPVYPFKEPADATRTGPTGSSRMLKLFMLAPYRVEPRVGPTVRAFPSTDLRTVWAGTVDRPVVEAAATACGLPAAEVATLAGRNWTLTEFDDVYAARPAATDLYFRPAADQSAVERPPVVVYEDIYWPYTAAAGGLLAGGPVVLWLAWRLIRRALRRLPAAPLD